MEFVRTFFLGSSHVELFCQMVHQNNFSYSNRAARGAGWRVVLEEGERGSAPEEGDDPDGQAPPAMRGRTGEYETIVWAPQFVLYFFFF